MTQEIIILIIGASLMIADLIFCAAMYNKLLKTLRESKPRDAIDLLSFDDVVNDYRKLKRENEELKRNEEELKIRTLLQFKIWSSVTSWAQDAMHRDPACRIGDNVTDWVLRELKRAQVCRDLHSKIKP